MTQKLFKVLSHWSYQSLLWSHLISFVHKRKNRVTYPVYKQELRHELQPSTPKHCPSHCTKLHLQEKREGIAKGKGKHNIMTAPYMLFFNSHNNGSLHLYFPFYRWRKQRLREAWRLSARYMKTRGGLIFHPRPIPPPQLLQYFCTHRALGRNAQVPYPKAHVGVLVFFFFLHSKIKIVLM